METAIRQIETVEELMMLRDDWGQLLRESPSDSVFMTHEWLVTWWKHLRENRSLAILAVRNGGRLVGLAPLAIQEARYTRMMPRTLEFLGDGVIGSDYLDLLVKPGFEDEVFRSLEDHLTKTGLMLQLGQLRRGESLAEELGRRLEAGEWTAAGSRINTCPFVTLAGHTWDSYLSSLGSSQRYNFQRRLKNLDRMGMRLECATSPDSAMPALDILIALHRKRWESRRGESEAFQSAAVEGFHREFAGLAAERGWLRLFTLRIGETPAAALYGLRYGSTFYFYQSGFDPAYSKQSVGLVMMGLAIRSAIEEGAAEYDFLHGDEEYKFHWTRETRELGRLELYPPHARALIYRGAIDFNRAARKMARRVLPL